MPKNKNHETSWNLDVSADTHVYYKDEEAPLTTEWRDRILAARERPLEAPLVAFIPCELGWRIGWYPVIGWGLVPADLGHHFDMVAVGSRLIEAGGGIESNSKEDVLYAACSGSSLFALHALRAPGEREFDFQEQKALLTIDRLRRLDRYSLDEEKPVGIERFVRTSAS